MIRYSLFAPTMALLISCSVHGNAKDFPKWPLRNGDFSASMASDRPTGWEPSTPSGKHKLYMDPQATFANSPSAAVIETVEAGEASYYHRLSVLKGDYRLVVEALGTPGVSVHALVDGKRTKTIKGDGNWHTLEVDAPGLDGEIVVSLHTEASAGGKAKFRYPKLEIERVESAAVPLEGGGEIGEIVLPPNPTLPERYACYELQRFLFRMNGRTPGLKGRDATHGGTRIVLGSAASPELLKKLEGLASDAYVVDANKDVLTLAGKNPVGTLFAVYDYLHAQGCRWVIPGPLGEIIRSRDRLAPVVSKVESPDYDARALMVAGQDFFPTGGWVALHFDDYVDWMTRNRLNGIWTAGTKTYDFDAHRGHGWIQTLNHSYNNTVAPHDKHFKDHPEWYPLVDGERMPVCDIGPKFNNQLCVSNEELRDYTVDLIVNYFKENPNARAFPLNPMDAPSYWCECEHCKALDQPGLEWPADRRKRPTPGILTDRALNYANAVAERVSKVFPDKYIELLSYSWTLPAPVLNKVHKNVFVKYANLSGGRGTGPLGRSILDEDVEIWNEWRETLDGWKDAGATMAWYSYMEWEHPDVALFWFYNTVDLLKNLNRKYNFRMHCGETTNNFQSSVMHYNIVARALWDVDTDYVAVIRDLCPKFYGPAGETMVKYNLRMDRAVRESVAWKEKDWRPNLHQDVTLEALEEGRELLEVAADKVQGDPKLTKRVALARFGHANLTYQHTLHLKKRTSQSARAARAAFDLANALRHEHGILCKYPTSKYLASFYYPPVAHEGLTIAKLPETWAFKKDPGDVGLTEKWFEKKRDGSWKDISTLEDWTSQPPGKGYHGTAWYQVDFTFPAGTKSEEALDLHFGAVDGVADIFLDGRKIGEQKTNASFMWDKPFSISLPKDLDVTKSHSLAVKVHKNNFAAGIWKPVRIIKSAGDETK